MNTGDVDGGPHSAAPIALKEQQQGAATTISGTGHICRVHIICRVVNATNILSFTKLEEEMQQINVSLEHLCKQFLFQNVLSCLSR